MLYHISHVGIFTLIIHLVLDSQISYLSLQQCANDNDSLLQLINEVKNELQTFCDMKYATMNANDSSTKSYFMYFTFNANTRHLTSLFLSDC